MGQELLSDLEKKQATEQVFVHLCRTKLSFSDLEIVRRLQDQVDGKKLFLLAHWGGVAGLIARHLNHLNLSQDLYKKFVAASLETESKNKVLLKEAKGLCCAAETAGLVLIPIKGAALNMNLPYDDLGIRPMVDLDLVARRDQITKIEELLLDYGFRPKGQREQALRYLHHLTYVRFYEGVRIPIELHWTAFFEAYGNRQIDRAVIDRSLLHFFQDAKIRILDFEDMFLSLSLHLAVHRFRASFKWLVDLAEFGFMVHSKMRWDEIWKRAQALGGMRAVTYAILLVSEILQVSVFPVCDCALLPLLRITCPSSDLISSRAQPNLALRFVIDLLMRDSPLLGMNRILHKSRELLDRHAHVRLPKLFSRRDPLE